MTDRLILRNYIIDDAYSMYNNFYCDEQLSTYMAWYPHSNVECTRNKLVTQIIPYIGNPNILNVAITKKENPENIIGNFKAVICDNNATIGYILGKNFQHQGYIQETCKSIFNYLFDKTSIDKICACFEKENIASANVLDKLGFIYVKDEIEKRKIDSDDGDIVHCLGYELTKEVWLNVNK